MQKDKQETYKKEKLRGCSDEQSAMVTRKNTRGDTEQSSGIGGYPHSEKNQGDFLKGPGNYGEYYSAESGFNQYGAGDRPSGQQNRPGQHPSGQYNRPGQGNPQGTGNRGVPQQYPYNQQQTGTGRQSPSQQGQYVPGQGNPQGTGNRGVPRQYPYNQQQAGTGQQSPSQQGQYVPGQGNPQGNGNRGVPRQYPYNQQQTGTGRQSPSQQGQYVPGQGNPQGNGNRGVPRQYPYNQQQTGTGRQSPSQQGQYVPGQGNPQGTGTGAEQSGRSNARGEQAGGGQQTVVKNPRTDIVPEIKGPEMNDRDYLNEILATEKYLTNNFNTFLHEASHLALYNDLKQILNETHDCARDIFNLMFKDSFYSLKAAGRQELQQEQQKFNNYLNCQDPYQTQK